MNYVNSRTYCFYIFQLYFFSVPQRPLRSITATHTCFHLSLSCANIPISARFFTNLSTYLCFDLSSSLFQLSFQFSNVFIRPLDLHTRSTDAILQYRNSASMSGSLYILYNSILSFILFSIILSRISITFLLYLLWLSTMTTHLYKN